MATPPNANPLYTFCPAPCLRTVRVGAECPECGCIGLHRPGYPFPIGPRLHEGIPASSPPFPYYNTYPFPMMPWRIFGLLVWLCLVCID